MSDVWWGGVTITYVSATPEPEVEYFTVCKRILPLN